MKIIHICFVDAYSEGWAYHRNIISEKNRKDGHEVVILTSRYRMGEHGESLRTVPGVEVTKTGIKVIRLDNVLKFLPDKINIRVNWYKGVYQALCDEKPDIIMVHNLQFFNLDEVVKYKKEHSNVALLGDTHADKYNSVGKFKIWSKFRQKVFNAPRIKRNFSFFDRFFYITKETKEFFEEMYGIDLSNAIFAPLPAPIINKEEKIGIRERIFRELNIDTKKTLLFVHSGKMTKEKRTNWIFEALKRSDIDCKLVIIGSIPDDERQVFYKYLEEEPRAVYLGWLSASELRSYLAAADLYFQPGDQSVTMQNALSVGTPIVIYPYDGYQEFFNGCEFQISNITDIELVLQCLKNDRSILEEKSLKAYETAYRYFDIEKNAKLIYESSSFIKEQ